MLSEPTTSLWSPLKKSTPHTGLPFSFSAAHTSERPFLWPRSLPPRDGGFGAGVTLSTSWPDRGGQNWRVKAQSVWMAFFLRHIFQELQCHFSCPSAVLNNKSHNLLSNCSVPSASPMLFPSFFFNSFWLYHVACRILVPWPGMEPAHPRWKGRILTTRPARRSPHTPLLVLLTVGRGDPWGGPEELPLWGRCQQTAPACGPQGGLRQLQRCLLGVAVGAACI